MFHVSLSLCPIHTADGRTPAALKKPWNDDSPVTINKQKVSHGFVPFMEVPFWCIFSTRSYLVVCVCVCFCEARLQKGFDHAHITLAK